ncbi:MAG: zinc ABC transporter substrate-binding protein, partial [Nitrospiraceae bacterium]
MTPVRKLVVIAVSCLIIGLYACERQTPLSSGKLKILTTIAPLYSFVVNVAGDDALVENLLPAGAGPHEYALSPADARRAAEADVLVINGINLESWVQTLVDSASGKVRGRAKGKPIVVDSSAGIDIIGNDPHIWLSLKNAIFQVQNIRDALIRTDPDRRDAYLKNAGAYIERLEDLDREIAAEISAWKRKDLVAFHAAYVYFARDYGLEIAAVIQETPESEPSPRHIARVIEIIKERRISAIFTEPQLSHRIVNTLAADLGLQVYSLD